MLQVIRRRVVARRPLRRGAKRARSGALRALQVLLLSLSALCWWNTAGAQQLIQELPTDLGVTVALPTGLHAVAGLAATP